jgi:hypothetical protein
MKIVLKIDGGIGKSVAATGVVAAIKKQSPESKIIVITGYPEVFEGNRKVYEAIRHNELIYFYRNHIEGQPDTQFFFQEPYIATDFIYRRGHLIKVWCEMNGIKYNGELPELFISHKEKTAFGTQLKNTSKPILVIQTNGGMPNQTDKYSWPRDLPFTTAQKVVNHFAPTHNVIQIRRNDQPTLQNVYPAEGTFKQLAVLILMSQKRLFIDSFAQHTAAALGLPSVVCWIANEPSQFGYEMHHNLIANTPSFEPELRNAVLSKYNTNGPETEFPYNDEDEIFDFHKIVAALEGDKKKTEEDSKKKVKPLSLENV